METIDITPTPRILRTLGEIPFEVWQCLAELSDNSLDAFRELSRQGIENENRRLNIAWSKEEVPSADREIVVVDNGPGMSLASLQNAARAGYSSNDPVGNLGLFGMGFNIATARLGEETTFLSTTKGDAYWHGIIIDFAELINKGTFAARVERREKERKDDSGTKIIVRRLREGVFQDLRSKESAIRKRLEVIYTSIIERAEAEIYVQGKALRPFRHCTWGPGRFVTYRGQQVKAIQEIDLDLGEAWFDPARNRYLSDFETDEGITATASGYIRRPRKLKGWIGIQRFADPSRFGIDFIRNGRKILVADRTLFQFESPDTGSTIVEYPVELGSTVGGRIVGELHVDYLIPTYQKNGFDTSDKSWRLTVDAVRGGGPILPKRRQALGYSSENSSPLGLLVNAYRRVDPGTRSLFVAREPSQTFLVQFEKGNPEYQSDEKWYKAAQEADRARGGEGSGSLSEIDAGESASDNISDYEPASVPIKKPITQPESKWQFSEQLASSTKASLQGSSEKNSSLTGQYSYNSARPPFRVTAWRVNNQHIKLEGKRVPCALFQDGIEIDFFFDETHAAIDEYPITPKQLLLQSLSEKFFARDQTASALDVFIELVGNYMSDERINAGILKERAHAAMETIRESLPRLLSGRLNDFMSIVNSRPTELELFIQNLINGAPELVEEYQRKTEKAVLSMSHVTDELVIALIESMPEEFCDSRLFKIPFSSISVSDNNATERARKHARDRLVSLIREISSLLRSNKRPTKVELSRYANTLTLLEDLRV